MSTPFPRHLVLALLLAVLGSACAASPSKSPRSASSPAAPSDDAPRVDGPASEPAAPLQFAPPPPAPGVAPAQPAGGAGGASSRAMALQGASTDIETAQRELDVAAGDCRNACRALGSMDRAAGKVCELSRGDDDGHRCNDARTRVYSARARVKTTCGECPGGPSVERTAPIPSLR